MKTPEIDFERPHYCSCRINSGSCAQWATWQVDLCKRDESHEAAHLKTKSGYRCDEHKNKGTAGYKVYRALPLDQSWGIQKVNAFLDKFIGKTIVSKVHTARGLEVKYRKGNGGLMCFQPITKKWKYVYYNQIKEVVSI